MTLKFKTNTDSTEILQNGKVVATIDENGISGSLRLGQVSWWAMRSSIQAGDGVLDGQELSQATYPEFHQMLVDGLLPTVSEATWQSDPTQRGKFVVSSSTGKFRLADYNGKSSGSLGAVVLRGDGALSAGEDGVIQRDAMQGHGHYIGGMVVNGGGVTPYSISFFNGVGDQTGKTTTQNVWANDIVKQPVTDGTNGTPRTATETRMLNVTGCWVIKLFGAVTNVGSADAAQLASDYANLSAAHQTLDGELDFTIIYPNGGSVVSPANVAINSRYVEVNPFPNHHVICEAQVLVSGTWGNPGWYYAGAGAGAGVRAAQLNDNVVVQTNQFALASAGQYMGGPFGNIAAQTILPCRVKVWKLKGATA